MLDREACLCLPLCRTIYSQHALFCDKSEYPVGGRRFLCVACCAAAVVVVVVVVVVVESLLLAVVAARGAI